MSFFIAIILFFGRKSVSIGSVPACHKAGQSNIRLTCICVFDDEYSIRQSWRESCIKKSAALAATASSNFRAKTNVRLKRVLDEDNYLVSY